MKHPFDKKISQICSPVLQDAGYDLVCVRLSGTKKTVVEILIERNDTKPLTLGDCVKASRKLSVVLDVEDLFSRPYVLEVSSPGLDRPLVHEKDYHRFVGHTICVATHPLGQELAQEWAQDKKSIKGLLKTVSPQGIVLKNEEEKELFIDWKWIRECHLIPLIGRPSDKKKSGSQQT